MTSSQLKAWRKKLNLSQAGLAKMIRQNVHTVYQWESGRRKVPGFLEVLLPLINVGHAAQYRVNRKKRTPKSM